MNLKYFLKSAYATILEEFAEQKAYKLELIWILLFPLVEALRLSLTGKFIPFAEIAGFKVSYIVFMIIAWFGWRPLTRIMRSFGSPFARGIGEHYFFSKGGLLARPTGFAIYPLITLIFESVLFLFVINLLFGTVINAVDLVEFLVLLLLIVPVVFGISLFVAGLGLRYKRNVFMVIDVLIMVLYFISLANFPLEVVPEPFKFWAMLNPFAVMFEAARQVVFFSKTLFDVLPAIAFLIASGLILILLGYVYFKRAFNKARKTGEIKLV